MLTQQFLLSGHGKILFLVAIAASIYVYNAWSPSSYALTLRLVGASVDGLVAGTPRQVRSDEYMVLTPYMQIAVRNNFASYNELSPYKEPLKNAYALPVLDWSIVFKPQLWGFFVLSPARAYSLYFCALMVSFCVGYAILLRQFGAAGSISVLVAITFLSCHFVQVWWTNNAPTFALAPWPLIVHLSRLRWYLKLPLVFYAASVWLLSLLYPPFIIGAAFAFVILLLAFKPEQALRWRVVTPSALGVLAALGVVFAYFGDLIVTMRNSFYPGQREYSGGSLPWGMALANLFPYFFNRHFEPLFISPGTNASEIGAVSSFLPLAILVFCDPRSLLRLVRENPWRWGICAFGFGLVLAWQLLPLPPWVGRALQWQIVAPNRLQWGGGLILMLALGVMASSICWRFTLTRVLVATSLVVFAWVCSKRVLAGGDGGQKWFVAWFDGFFLLPLWIAFLSTRLPFDWSLQLRQRSGEALLTAVMVTNLATFGTFNPVQSAWPIFSAIDPPLISTLRQMTAVHPQKQVAIEGAYAAVLNGFGVSAINHILLTPNIDFFRRAFPKAPPETIWRAFNRYGQIIPAAMRDVELASRDAVLVPIHRFGLSLPVTIEDNSPAGGQFEVKGSVDSFNTVELGPQLWRVDVRGWCYCENWAQDQRLIVRPTALEGRGRVIEARAVRLPRPDVAKVMANEKLSYSGYLLSLEMILLDGTAKLTAADFDLFAYDPAVGTFRMSFPR